jgi:hypothetical protein
MKLAILILLVIPLLGCSPKSSVDRCTATAKSEHPRPVNMGEEEYVDSLIGQISICLDAAGYFYKPNQPDCDGSFTSAACYVRKGR